MKNERFEFKAHVFEKEGESNDGQIIALEGPVCAGKTTVLGGLREQEIPVVDEYSEYVASTTRDFPKFPPQDEEAAKDSFRFFFELEARRKQDMEATGNNRAVLDRSIYTLLAFEVGASRLTGISILPWAVEYLEENKDKIIMPEQVVYMDIPAEISRSRAREGQIRIADFLLTDGFNGGFRDFFMALKEKAPELVCIVDATGEQSAMQEFVLGLVSSENIV